MLETILGYLRNDFHTDEFEERSFTIADGTISLPFVVDGQYFKIEGSKLNDGVYLYPATELLDESFSGRITALAIPRALRDKLPEFEKYEKWRSEQIAKGGAYSSESFNGYSYTIQTNADGTLFTACQYFKDFLKPWRKI